MASRRRVGHRGGGNHGENHGSPNPRRVALEALTAVEAGRGARIGRVLRVAGLPPRDQALARELALGTERQRLMLDVVLAQLVERRLPADPPTLSALRLGAYQLLFLWRVAAHAAVHETVALLGRQKAFANAVLRNLSRRIRAHDPAGFDPARELVLPGPTGGPLRAVFFDRPVLPAAGAARLALQHALPEFLVQRWWQRLGAEATEQACAASSASPSMTLWATGRSGGPEALAAKLAGEGVRTSRLPGSDLLVWTDGPSPLGGASFRDGQVLAQGPTAHAVALAVEAEPGQQVLDLCAAPGTKTMVLAEAVGESGRVFAYDVDPERRLQIEENTQRLGLGERVVVLQAPPEEAELPPLDRVLVDAPCSNTGVLSRRVEVRRRISEAAIQGLAGQQQSLLRQGLGLCRPGGRLVYATCSLEAEENQELVRSLAAGGVEAPTCRVVREHLALPRAPAHDGGYFAVLETML